MKGAAKTDQETSKEVVIAVIEYYSLLIYKIPMMLIGSTSHYSFIF